LLSKVTVSVSVVTLSSNVWLSFEAIKPEMGTSVMVMVWVSEIEPNGLLAVTVMARVPGISQVKLTVSVRPWASVMGGWSLACQT
jgi:hypothetical protein